jgi:hypothetical protein
MGNQEKPRRSELDLKRDKVYNRVSCPGYDARMVSKRSAGFGAAVLWVASLAAWPQSLSQSAVAPLSTAQIVARIELRDQARTRDLKSYRSERHYEVEYHGFPEDLAASVVVEARFDAASGKSFQTVSQRGSKFLIDKVLKRALDSEKEASQNKASTALTPANYRFNLLGNETLATGPAYILLVDPHQPSKFLYRGKIWVDATDFAVVKMETQPAKNPSFWISKTAIQTTSIKVAGLWFPEKLRSETKVRLGGTAVLSIEFGSYEVEVNPPPAIDGR